MAGAVELLKLQADTSFRQLEQSFAGLTEGQAWAVMPPVTDEYLHTNGSIQSLVLHVAGCKFIYGSAGFRDLEIRWRDIADKLDAFEPSWEAAQGYLREAHAYWLSSWESLTDEDLDVERLTFHGRLWPTWKIIHTVTDHDAYHAGQIAVMRYQLKGESAVPPPTEASDIRRCCADLVSW